MKKLSIKIAFWLMFSLCVQAAVYAGDSVSLSISCTIPAIPGVNVAMIEEEAVKSSAADPAAVKEETEAQQKEEDSESEAPRLFQTEFEGQVFLAKGQNSPIIVRTVYSR